MTISWWISSTLLIVLGYLVSCQNIAPATLSKISSHDDEGPADRYAIPYEPITYGQTGQVPLPGLAYDYKLYDWDQDGLVDILANIRRGGGLVFYKNVGTAQEPLFRSLQENQRIIDSDRLGQYFDVIDVDQDGRAELISYSKESEGSPYLLTVYFNQSSYRLPQWKAVAVTTPKGDTIQPPDDINDTPRLSVGDWNQDGKPDLIIGFEHISETVPPELPQLGGSRMAGFRDPAVYHPNTGEVQLLLNVTQKTRKPIFQPPVRLKADNQAITTYINPYPTIVDINQDGLLDLLVGSHNTQIRVFINRGTTGQPLLKKGGLLSDPNGQSIRTFLTIRVDAADIDGDGQEELVGASYYGNQNRYVVYQRDQIGWKDTGYLNMMANPDTPVYGMGNSTVDPVDWDSDGDTDLLLGAEGGFPTIVINTGNENRRVFKPARRLQYADGTLLETFSIEQGDGSYWGPLEWYSDRIAPRAADWDGDGILDIITGSMGRRLYFFKGTRVQDSLRFQRPQNFKYKQSDLVLPDRLFPAVVNWNGDQFLDIIASNDPGHIVIYLGSGTLNLESADTLRHVNKQPIVLKDFWGRKKGNRSGFTVADWDADGHRDLIVYQFHRGVFLFRNAGDDTYEAEQLLVPLYSHLAGPSVMDWDRDGHLDLIIGGDERRMIEPSVPAHLVVYHGKDTYFPPKKMVSP